MNQDREDILDFVAPKEASSYIKVIGVGGGGCNAVNHMYRQGIRGVDFVVCNLDAQALNASPVPNKVMLGKKGLGLGAGCRPEIAQRAAMEKKSEIKALFEHNTRMIFITAGMGGGTGTGAAPVIASIAKEIEIDDEINKILVVGIVTTPLKFEGNKKRVQARAGIEELKKHVDALMVINNDKILELYKSTTITNAFARADEVLSNAAKAISETITVESTINTDFMDVNTVMMNSGVALMGCGEGKGEDRAKEAVLKALDSPLLNNNNIRGAKNALLHISYSRGGEILTEDLAEITQIVNIHTGTDTDMIWGFGEDNSLEEGSVKVTLIVTGFKENAYQEEEAEAPTRASISTDGAVKSNIVALNVGVVQSEPAAQAASGSAQTAPSAQASGSSSQTVTPAQAAPASAHLTQSTQPTQAQKPEATASTEATSVQSTAMQAAVDVESIYKQAEAAAKLASEKLQSKKAEEQASVDIAEAWLSNMMKPSTGSGKALGGGNISREAILQASTAVKPTAAVVEKPSSDYMPTAFQNRIQASKDRLSKLKIQMSSKDGIRALESQPAYMRNGQEEFNFIDTIESVSLSSASPIFLGRDGKPKANPYLEEKSKVD